MASTDTHAAYTIATCIYKTFPIVFLAVGTVANILSAVIYSKKKMRKTSYSVYLFTLAIVDLFVTLTGNTRILLMSYDFTIFHVDVGNVKSNSSVLVTDVNDQEKSSSQSSTLIPFREFQRLFLQHSASHDAIFKGVDIRETSVLACRLHRFLTYFLMQLSSSILCMLSIDRFFGCVLVLKAGRLCKPSIARKIVLAITLTLALFNSHFLTSMGHTRFVHDPAANRTYEFVQCEASSSSSSSSSSHHYVNFWTAYFYMDSLIYCILPFVIMITCNILIISKIVSSRIRSKQVIFNRIAKKSKTNYSMHKSSSYQPQLHQNSTINNTKLSSASANNNSSNYMLSSERRISFILIGISVSFIVLTLPEYVMEHLNDREYEARPYMELGLAIASMLMYFNHVVNFFFYCSLGLNFRKEVRKLLPHFFSHGRVSPARCKTVFLASSSRVPNFANRFTRHHDNVRAAGGQCRRLDNEVASYLNITVPNHRFETEAMGRKAVAPLETTLPATAVIVIDDSNDAEHERSVMCSPREMRQKLDAFKKSSMKKYTVSFTNTTTSSSNGTNTTATTSCSSSSRNQVAGSLSSEVIDEIPAVNETTAVQSPATVNIPTI
jgi:hypothetical protein